MATKELEKVHINDLISMAGFEIIKGTVKPIDELKKERVHYYLNQYLEDYTDKVGQPCYYLVDTVKCNEIRLILLGDTLTKSMQIDIFDELSVYMSDLVYDDIVREHVSDEIDMQRLLYNGNYETLYNYIVEHNIEINDFDMAWLRIIGLGEHDLLREDEC